VAALWGMSSPNVPAVVNVTTPIAAVLGARDTLVTFVMPKWW
jgi:hypothetical protein